jgi:hypothetical protein
MVVTINNPYHAKKDYTGSLSEEEVEQELSLVYDSQICPQCKKDHSFKNIFDNVITSIDDFLNIRNRILVRAVSIADYEDTMMEG